MQTGIYAHDPCARAPLCLPLPRPPRSYLACPGGPDSACSLWRQLIFTSKLLTEFHLQSNVPQLARWDAGLYLTSESSDRARGTIRRLRETDHG